MDIRKSDIEAQNADWISKFSNRTRFFWTPLVGRTRDWGYSPIYLVLLYKWKFHFHEDVTLWRQVVLWHITPPSHNTGDRARCAVQYISTLLPSLNGLLGVERFSSKCVIWVHIKFIPNLFIPRKELYRWPYLPWMQRSKRSCDMCSKPTSKNSPWERGVGVYWAADLARSLVPWYGGWGITVINDNCQDRSEAFKLLLLYTRHGGFQVIIGVYL